MQNGFRPEREPLFYQIMDRLLLLLLLVLLVSCKGEEDEPVADSTTERTVLVWLAGDNNLSSEVPRKISALAQGYLAAKQPDTRLLIYADRRNDYPQLIEITGKGELKILATYPAHNSASPETLNRMLTEMMATAPARSYGLILFSHATGWLPTGALEHPTDYFEAKSLSRSIFDDNGDQMSIQDFAKALPCAFDYITFENCFTAGIEVAYELRNKADRILVSSAEILSPGFEEIYFSSLGLLMQPDADLNSFAQKYFEYRNAMSGNHRSATVSVINTYAVGALADLARSIESSTVPIPEEDLQFMQRFNRHNYTLFFDLAEYLEMRAPDRETEISAAISNAVEYAANTATFMPGSSYNGFHIDRHCGLTTYIPQSRFPELNEEYYKTEWYKATH